MTDIVFLTLEDVLALHDDAIAFAGGSSGVRLIDLLQGQLLSRKLGLLASGRTRSHSEWRRRTPTT